MKVLHLCKTPIAGAPGMLSRMLDRYSSWESSVYCLKTKLIVGDFSMDYRDTVTKDQLDWRIREADLIHYHNSGPSDWGKNISKPFVIQLHSEPAILARLLKTYPDAKFLVLAQKHAVLYKNTFEAVPNLIPIWDEGYMPDNHAGKPLHIFYAPTSTVKIDDYTHTCRGKGFWETMEVFRQLKSQYGDSITVSSLMEKPKDHVLQVKRTADIVIDECVTGGYHLSSLEGLSMGCITIANISQEVKEVMAGCVGQEATENLPWILCGVDSLKENLIAIIEQTNIDISMEDKKRYSREWIEKFWDPRKLVNKYTNIYNKMLGIETNPWAKLNISNNLPALRSAREKVIEQCDKDTPIKMFRGIHKNKPALIIGNGPSQKKIDISAYRQLVKPVTFTCNYYFKGLNMTPNYWCCVDSGALGECKDLIPAVTMKFLSVPTRHIPVNGLHSWIQSPENLKELAGAFDYPFEFDRPCTVATLMTLMALYMGCNPIYIIGVDLSTSKGAENYAYSGTNEKYFNEKFRDFSTNLQHILKEFKMMRHEAGRRGTKIINLDPKPENFTVFEKLHE